jgi:hypothetical protein
MALASADDLCLLTIAGGYGFYRHLQAQWWAEKAQHVDSPAVSRASQIGACRLADAA